jgi:hypothetical protein
VPVTPRVDLLLYVNSANDARLSLARVQSLQANPITVRHPDFDGAACATTKVDPTICRPYPLLVAITSHGDAATKYLLPIASSLNYDANVASVPPRPQGTFLDEIPSEGRYRKSAAAHMPFMQSHDVRKIACPLRTQIEAEIIDRKRATGETPGADGKFTFTDQESARLRRRAPACKPEDPTCRFAFRTHGEDSVCYEVHERRGNASGTIFNQTSYWVMAVDPAVVRDHGDIWNLSFVEMLGELMAPRGFFEPGTRRVQLSVQPPGSE